MSETIQVEEQSLAPAPKLLIEWSSPWREFYTSIGPAFSRSGARLAGEAPFRMFPYRKIVFVCVGEFLFLLFMIWLPDRLARLRPYIAPQPAPNNVIYYSGDELPQTEDLGGSQSGAKGRAGGQEAHHRTQTIRIARGSSLVAKVVDAPNLKIPASRDAVANLIAMRPNPGPPPSEGLKSARSAPSANAIIAPPPSVLKDLTRTAPNLDSVVAPAPSMSADPSRRTLTLDPSLIVPAPTLAQQYGRAAPSLNTNVVAPANTEVSSRSQRTAPTVSTNIVPPSPALSGNETPRTAVQAVNPSVVPPPVSAPERESTRTARLTMPAPSVIAPPPTPAPDMRQMPTGGATDPSRNVVQPPPSAPASGSFVSSLIGKIFGDNQVVPPPPSVSGDGGGVANGRSPNGGNAVGAGPTVIAPPPAVSGGSGTGSRAGTSLASGAASGVVQPPPSVSEDATGRSSSGTALASNVVAPPPSLNPAGGAGQGNRGAGLGSALDAGSVTAPPKTGGSGHDSGVVVTNQPGSKVGLPSGTAGNLAMSPAGGDTPGLGGTGGGKGVVPGNGPGSGLTAEGPGAGKTGAGRGAQPDARGGISPTAGPGGAGSATSGTPPVPGVSVSGGSSIVTLPSFGDSGGSNSGTPGRSATGKSNQGFDVSVIGTSRSGGAFNYYGLLPNDATSVYLQTPLGLATFQYSETTPAARNSAALTNPQLLHADPLSGVATPRLTVTCTLDVYGSLKNLKILDSDHAATVPKVVAALGKWKFRPAMRGDQPVEVVAILGFGTDTNDRY